MDDGTVIGRATEIIFAVNEWSGPISLANLTRMTGIPKPTVRRIADTLVARGLLSRAESGYSAGFTLVRIGVRALQRSSVDALVRPYLDELYRRSRGGVAWYATVDQAGVTIVATAHGNIPAELLPPTWPSRMSETGEGFAATVPGRLWLAAKPDRIAELPTEEIRRITPHTVVAPGLIRQLVSRAHDEEYAEEREQVRLGVQCCAVPLLDRLGAIVGIVGVTAPTNGGLPSEAVRRSRPGLERDLTSLTAF